MLEAKDQIINYRHKTKDYLRNIESIFNWESTTRKGEGSSY